jgi:hypothetical protein
MRRRLLWGFDIFEVYPCHEYDGIVTVTYTIGTYSTWSIVCGVPPCRPS